MTISNREYLTYWRDRVAELGIGIPFLEIPTILLEIMNAIFELDKEKEDE